jgi:hypothetical protein
MLPPDTKFSFFSFITLDNPRRVMFWENFIPLFRGSPIDTENKEDDSKEGDEEIVEDEVSSSSISSSSTAWSSAGFDADDEEPACDVWYKSVAFFWATFVLSIAVLLLSIAGLCLYATGFGHK